MDHENLRRFFYRPGKFALVTLGRSDSWRNGDFDEPVLTGSAHFRFLQISSQCPKVPKSRDPITYGPEVTWPQKTTNSGYLKRTSISYHCSGSSGFLLLSESSEENKKIFSSPGSDSDRIRLIFTVKSPVSGSLPVLCQKPTTYLLLQSLKNVQTIFFRLNY